MKGGIVGILWVVFQNGYDRCGIHEPREVVHMAVGVVTGDSILQPENIGHAEIFAEDLRVILFGETRISFLHFA